MSDHLDLVERFEPLATAPFTPVTATSVLQQRVAERRRTRRTFIAGGIAAAVAILGALGVLAALAAPTDHGPVDELRTVAPAEAEQPSVPASYGTDPRLVIGAVPADLASEGCGVQELVDRSVVTCSLGVPATAVPDGINLLFRPATPEVTAAWARGDEAAVAAALRHVGPVSFTTLGGRDALALGETSRVPGATFGLPDRVTSTYELLIGDSLIQINAEGVTDEQLGDVARNLSTAPVDLGFAISVDALPSGAKAIAQGEERLWSQPDRLDPSRSDDNGGRAAGISYAVDGAMASLAVHVVRDVDAPSYVDAWAAQQDRTDVEVGPVIANGRSGHLARERRAVEGETQERLAVAVDDTTVVIVEGPTSQHDALLAIAGRTRVAEVAGVAGVAPAAPAAPTTDPGGAPADTTTGAGWYIPSQLPDGWVLDRGQAQATDGSGEAQLWLTSPSGNVVVVGLKVPRDGAGPSDRAERHPVAGSTWPVFAEPVGEGGPSYQYLTTVRPDAIVDVYLLGTPTGGEPSASGLDETDELMAALVPVTADTWRTYLSEVPAPPVLLDAATLVDLPDES